MWWSWATVPSRCFWPNEKAPGIPIDSRTFAQAVRYNSVLNARYLILTNGLRHYCCECRDGEYVRLDGFPNLSGEPSRP